MNIRRSTVIGITAMVCALNAANAQDIFFTDDLTDETSVNNHFNINLPAAGANGVEGGWGFSSDPIIQVYGADRTNITAGATIYDLLDYSVTTNDSDNVRTYLATKFGGYSTNSWKAHVAVETPTTGDPNLNYLFFGLGNGLPNPDYYNEPSSGDQVRLTWRNDGGKDTYLYTGTDRAAYSGLSTIGTDVYMTYNAASGILKIELDNWASDGTRFNGIDRTFSTDLSALSFSGDTEARIFLGANSTTTFSDFSVEEFIPTTPSSPLNMYAWPDNPGIVTVRWNEEALTSLGYNVYRSLEAAANYVQIATGLMATNYVDSDVINGISYYYKVSGVNDFGEGELTGSDIAVPNPYLIIGTDGTYKGNPYITKHNLFDGDIDTYFDSSESGTSWGGLDYGDGNAYAIRQVNFTIRGGWGKAFERTVGATIQGANTADFSDAVTLYTVTTNDAAYPTLNEISISDTTPFRYVRIHSSPSYPLYGVAELGFITDADFTENGTPKYWLAKYGLAEADDEVDNDLDGLLSWEEYVAGTDPTNSASVLMANSLIGLSGDEYVVTWQSVAGKNYSVLSSSDLVNGTPSLMATNIMGMAVETAYTTTVSGASSTFFEIGVD